jgi:tetratricopeptide (TPR) repeat protein
LASFLYANSLHGGFTLDDKYVVMNNPVVRSAALDLDRLLATDYWGTPITAAASHKSYRPLTVLTVWLNHRAHGLDVRGYHVVNVLLHALASVLVFYVAKAIMRIGAPAGVSDRAQHPTAAWAALLFAVHPVHVEAVANVAGRAELLSACFYLATFLAASQWRSGAQGKVTLEHTSQAATWPRMCFRLAVTAILLVASVACKESGITALVVAAAANTLDEVARRRSDSRHRSSSSSSSSSSLRKGTRAGTLTHTRESTIRREELGARVSVIWARALLCELPLVAITGAVFWRRLRVHPGSWPSFAEADNPAAHCSDLATRVQTIAYLNARHLALLFAPIHLCPDYSGVAVPLITNFKDPRNASTLVVLGTVFAVTAYLLYRVLRTSGGHIASGIAGEEMGNGAHERSRNGNDSGNGNDGKDTRTVSPRAAERPDTATFLHALPDTDASFSYLACVAWVLVSYTPSSHVFITVGFVLAERTMYTPSVGLCIAAPLLMSRLLDQLRQRPATGTNGQPTGTSSNAAVPLSNSSGSSTSSTAATPSTSAPTSSSSRTIARRLVLLLANAVVVACAARTLARNRDWRGNLSLWSASYAQCPHNARTLNNLGKALQRTKQLAQAFPMFRDAAALNPTSPEPLFNMGMVWQQLGNHSRAIGSYEAALALHPRYTSALMNLGAAYHQLGQVGKAVEYYRRALALKPGDGIARKNLAIAEQQLAYERQEQRRRTGGEEEGQRLKRGRRAQPKEAGKTGTKTKEGKKKKKKKKKKKRKKERKKKQKKSKKRKK